MNLFFAILLGIVQGLTEFLPVSSTAHLTLVGKALGVIDPARPEDWTAFMAIVQLGTIAAVITYFFKNIVGIGQSFVRDVRANKGNGSKRWSEETRLGWKILIGTLPVVLVGLAFKRFIEGSVTKETTVIAGSLIVLAILLYWSEKIGKHTRTEAQTTWKDALIIGIAQVLAVIPGSSRSGTTITTGLFLGLKRETAARFSFLLSIPAVLGSGLFEMYQARVHLSDMGILPIAASMIAAAIVGYGSIAFLLRYLARHTTSVFIAYRIALGVLLLGFWFTKQFDEGQPSTRIDSKPSHDGARVERFDSSPWVFYIEFDSRS